MAKTLRADVHILGWEKKLQIYLLLPLSEKFAFPSIINIDGKLWYCYQYV